MHVYPSAAADGKSVDIMAGSHPDAAVIATVTLRDGKAVVDLKTMPITVDLAKYVEALAMAGELLA